MQLVTNFVHVHLDKNFQQANYQIDHLKITNAREHTGANNYRKASCKPSNIRRLFLFMSNSSSILVIIELFATLFMFNHVYISTKNINS